MTTLDRNLVCFLLQSKRHLRGEQSGYHQPTTTKSSLRGTGGQSGSCLLVEEPVKPAQQPSR